MQKLKKLGLIVAGLGIVASPLVALAQLGDLPAPEIVTFGDVESKFQNAANWAFTILIFIAIIFVLLAAWRYLTASGDPEKVKTANHTLLYAAIAVAVALLANSLPAIVDTFIGTGTIVPTL